jgi:hypothetical protein
MNRYYLTILFFMFLKIGYSQKNNELNGTWKFQQVTTTNQNCKDVDYFPVSTFKFSDNGKAEFISEEGIFKADYTLKENIIGLYNLSENNIKQDGAAHFRIKSIDKENLIITVTYECGSIDIEFKK